MSSIIDGTWVDNGAKGGTELMIRRLLSAVGDEFLSDVQIHASRVDEVVKGAKQVLWAHDLPSDPMYGHLHETFDRWDAIVFVSHWQRHQFHEKFRLDWSKTHVIPNCIEPLNQTSRVEGPVKFVYSSMPNRGLEIVVPVFEALIKNGYDVELDVFSSFKLYNQEQNDVVFKQLFDHIESNERMNYLGTVPNTELRGHLEQSDAFVHPGINRPETSCLCLIEAMSAGLICVHSSFGALPETSKGLTWMYDAASDLTINANRLYREIAMITHLFQNDRDRVRQSRLFQKQLIDHCHNLNVMKQKWTNLLTSF